MKMSRINEDALKNVKGDGLRGTGSMSPVMTDAIDASETIEKNIEDAFEEKTKEVKDFIEDNNKNDAIPVKSRELKKLHLSEAMFDDESVDEGIGALASSVGSSIGNKIADITEDAINDGNAYLNSNEYRIQRYEDELHDILPQLHDSYMNGDLNAKAYADVLQKIYTACEDFMSLDEDKLDEFLNFGRSVVELNPDMNITANRDAVLSLYGTNECKEIKEAKLKSPKGSIPFKLKNFRFEYPAVMHIAFLTDEQWDVIDAAISKKFPDGVTPSYIDELFNNHFDSIAKLLGYKDARELNLAGMRRRDRVDPTQSEMDKDLWTSVYNELAAELDPQDTKRKLKPKKGLRYNEIETSTLNNDIIVYGVEESDLDFAKEVANEYGIELIIKNEGRSYNDTYYKYKAIFKMPEDSAVVPA